MSDDFRSQSGKPYSAQQWLDSHHSIKSKLRSELAASLPINAGDRVLDIGCGTGVWTFLMSDIIGNDGNILGIDLDDQALQLAEQRRTLHHHADTICFNKKDAMNIKSRQKFDVITLFNTLCYLPEPEVLLAKLTRLLTPGGRLIVKDSDLGSDFFWPVDVELYHRLMGQITNRGSIQNDVFYDPFFARRLPGLIKSSGYRDIESISQSFSFTYPFDEKQMTYISANANMIADHAAAIGDHEGAKKWRRQFEVTHPNCIFNDERFLYSMTEFVFHARTPSNS